MEKSRLFHPAFISMAVLIWFQCLTMMVIILAMKEIENQGDINAAMSSAATQEYYCLGMEIEIDALQEEFPQHNRSQRLALLTERTGLSRPDLMVALARCAREGYPLYGIVGPPEAQP